MTIALWFFGAYVIAGSLYWLLNAVMALQVIRGVALLDDAPLPQELAWPRISLIVPACNEANTLEPAMASRLREDYPDLEIILVDDRSSDGTDKIVDRIAASDSRVKALHITMLPVGWLGKVYAMHRGVQVATGEWFLFSDADVHFTPGTLRRAIAHYRQRGLDHLAAFPRVESAGFWLDVAIAGFIRLFLLGIRPWAIEDPWTNAHIGIGAFNLVRRMAFERTQGFEWLKLDLGDDVALGMMLKRNGARSGMVNAALHVSVCWYDSLAQMARGSERGGFTVLARFSLLRALVLGTVMLCLELSPFVALLPMGLPVLQAVGGITAVLALAAATALNAWARRPVLPALLLPVASIVLVGFVIRAGYLGWRRGGIVWRGTFYQTQMLRKGARVRFP